VSGEPVPPANYPRRLKMTATIKSLSPITYRDGYITLHPDVFSEEEERETIELVCEDYEVIETGCRGWNDKNAVIRDPDGAYYLANLS